MTDSTMPQFNDPAHGPRYQQGEGAAAARPLRDPPSPGAMHDSMAVPGMKYTGSAPEAGAAPRPDMFSDNGAARKEPFDASGYVDGDPLYQAGKIKPGRLSKMALMAGVFVVGATVGLASAWWISHQGAGAVSSRDRAAAVVTNMRLDQAQQGTGRRGISSSELPYDGNAPPKDASASSLDALLEKPGTLLHDNDASADNAAFAKAAPDASALAAVRSMEGQEAAAALAMPSTHDSSPPAETSKTPQGSNASSLAAVPPPPKPGLTTAPKADARAPVASAQDKQKERKVVKATRNNRESVKSAANDQEIKRIRNQASQELRYKNDSGSAAEEARLKALGAKREAAERAGRDRAQSGAIRTASKSAMIERCERVSNIIRREQCKWEVCGGMWGKNGCPSYERQASAY